VFARNFLIFPFATTGGDGTADTAELCPYGLPRTDISVYAKLYTNWYTYAGIAPLSVQETLVVGDGSAARIK
jgi:hypothetical protein